MEHDFVIITSQKDIGRRDIVKQGVIARLLRTTQGKSQLAQAMAAPIRRNLNYQGIARRIFSIDPLPTGAKATYDKDVNITECISEKKDLYGHNAVIITPHKKIGQRDKGSGIFGTRVTVPTFEVVSNPTVKISEIKSRRFNLIDRYEVNPHDSIIITSKGKMGRREVVNSPWLLNGAVQKARQQIMAQEDAEIFKILDNIAETGFVNK